MFLPNVDKTLKPVTELASGVGGGEKYLSHGICMYSIINTAFTILTFSLFYSLFSVFLDLIIDGIFLFPMCSTHFAVCVVFKFAVDLYGVYGGDEFAMKTAEHELKVILTSLFLFVSTCVQGCYVCSYGDRRVASPSLIAEFLAFTPL